jgi:acylphosphatase
MGSDADVQGQWDAFLQLLHVREPKFYQHMKSARPKEVTKYNLVLMVKNQEDLREVEVGLKVYQEKVEEFTSWVFGSPRGIKTELASAGDWKEKETVSAPSAVSEVPAVSGAFVATGDQNELLRILENSIRQKVEGELRETFQKEMDDPALKGRWLQQAREDLQEEEQNRRLAVRLTLIADGDKALSDLMMAWQQAKQNGDGGPPWNEAKARLLELLDTTVQLIQS